MHRYRGILVDLAPESCKWGSPFDRAKSKLLENVRARLPEYQLGYQSASNAEFTRDSRSLFARKHTANDFGTLLVCKFLRNHHSTSR
jgi:hypothetical protein